MDKRLLIIDDKDSFIVRTMKADLEASKYECKTSKLNIEQLDKIKEDIPQLIFLAMEPEMAQNMPALVYLRDLCIECNCRLIPLGYDDDVKTIKKIITAEYVPFEFIRPVNAKEASARIKKFVEQSGDNSRKKHILVVDDSGTMLNTIKSWLEADYRVSVVNSALNAISFLANNKPDLILLDYDMPVCTGPQLLEMIRSDIKTQDIPVIFLTAKGDRESVMKVLSLRTQGYLLKSMPKEHITAEIEAFFIKQKAQSVKK